jgi:hypothetical protein
MGDAIVVITADVVGSSAFDAKDRLALLKRLEKCLGQMRGLIPDFAPEIFQGDSFQGSTVAHRTQALHAGLFAITHFASHNIGLRLAVGVGTISLDTGENLTSDGTAYQQSGRKLDLLKKTNELIQVGFADDANTQAEWSIHSATMNHLLKRCTKAQAQALSLTLAGGTQASAASAVGVKQSAIQQRLSAAGWPLLQLILQRFAQAL